MSILERCVNWTKRASILVNGFFQSALFDRLYFNLNILITAFSEKRPVCEILGFPPSFTQGSLLIRCIIDSLFDVPLSYVNAVYMVKC